MTISTRNLPGIRGKGKRTSTARLTSARPSRLVCTFVLLLVACGSGKKEDAGDSDDSDDSAEAGLTEPSPTDGGDAPLDDPCNPAVNVGTDCMGGAVCCSDDPATTQGRLPNYFQNGVIDEKYGTPIFSSPATTTC